VTSAALHRLLLALPVDGTAIELRSVTAAIPSGHAAAALLRLKTLGLVTLRRGELSLTPKGVRARQRAEVPQP
jgi:hypothetical protein